jgi:hypothetical protein
MCHILAKMTGKGHPPYIEQLTRLALAPNPSQSDNWLEIKTINNKAPLPSKDGFSHATPMKEQRPVVLLLSCVCVCDLAWEPARLIFKKKGSRNRFVIMLGPSTREVILASPE